MYRTYQNKESESNTDLRFEEKLTPKEITDNKSEKANEKKACNPPSSSKNLSDDLFLLLIIFLLIRDEGQDNLLLFLIIALAFIH